MSRAESRRAAVEVLVDALFEALVRAAVPPPPAPQQGADQ